MAFINATEKDEELPSPEPEIPSPIEQSSIFFLILNLLRQARIIG